VELIICNDEGRPEKSVGCARDMLDKRVTMIFSNSPTASSRAIQPLVPQGPPLIIPSPNSYATPDSYGFQISTTTETNNTAIARFLSENGIRKLGMVVATDATGEAEVNAARKVYPGSQHRTERSPASISVPRTHRRNLPLLAGPDVPVVLFSYSGGGAATVVKSFKNLGLQQPMNCQLRKTLAMHLWQLINDVVRRASSCRRCFSAGARALEGSEPARKRSRISSRPTNKRYGEPIDQLSLERLAPELDVAEAILRNVSNPYDFPAVKKFLETTSINGTRFKGFSRPIILAWGGRIL